MVLKLIFNYSNKIIKVKNEYLKLTKYENSHIWICVSVFQCSAVLAYNLVCYHMLFAYVFQTKGCIKKK